MIELNQLTPVVAAEDAALLDMGDGICCLEFRSKGNSITPTIKEFVLHLLDKDLYGFDGMVIGSQSKFFSAGADLKAMLDKIRNNQFHLFEDSVNYFQQMNYRIKYYNKPIVAAPYGMTLGGGLEIALHSHQRVARAKSYMGLVEIGVGLLPSGGGTKETALMLNGMTADQNSAEILNLYDRLLLGTVSKNAAHAGEMGYLTAADLVVDEAETQLDEAKKVCLELVAKKETRAAGAHAILPGRDAYNLMVNHAEQLLVEGKIAPHDLYIGKHLALILAGSAEAGISVYSEQQILDTERACFIDLLRHPMTQERIAHFLSTGEKLRN